MTDNIAHPPRKPSFSEEESCFLKALLIDPTHQEEGLNEEQLFSIPKTNGNIPKPKRPSVIGLWKAHEKGISPQKLAQRGSLHLPSPTDEENDDESTVDQKEGDQNASLNSNHETGKHDEESSNSSWEDHYENFDTWKLLEDEYAGDFGFDFHSTTSSIDDILEGSDVPTFTIIGTSASDMSAQPHVLSPPLMDSLQNFLPERLQGENFWLKFSLVRDGASLETLKRYAKACTYTIIAIETIDGQVFGSFTSSRWSNHFSYYGSAPAFVWKMRHSRRTKCYSLFDQAQLESEVDIFMYTGETDFVQVCRHNGIAVGGDDADAHSKFDEEIRSGFAFALDDDLLYGTTSPTTTFKNPPLAGKGEETCIFQVAGLEVWTFTPCKDVESAQQMEMTRYIAEESSRRLITESQDTFNSTEIDSEKFYQRVGEDQESESRRKLWEHTNTMNATTTKGLGASPRFT